MVDAETRKYLNEYHRKHPWLFPAFCEAALKMKATGRKKYGAKSVMEFLRWNHDIQNPGSEFKISNNVTAYYARKAAELHPELDGFFTFKRVRGLSQAARFNQKMDERADIRNMREMLSTSGIQKAFDV